MASPQQHTAAQEMEMEYAAGTYHTHEQVQNYLRGWAAASPELCALGSLGKSSEGREISILTLTDSGTGSHEIKPAFWIDGNTHAGEVTGCEACLHFVHTLLQRWQAGDQQIVELLRSSALYVVPRISPDGAELYLTTPHTLRASTVLWPNATSPPGFLAEDLDGSGEILTMKVPDPAGAFKQSSTDPRLLVPRAPQDNDPAATYYNLLPEGSYKDYDGFNKEASTRWGLDTNRQYPSKWEPQESSGPLPLFLPESEAVAKGISARTNICSLLTYHTYGGEVRDPLAATDVDDLLVFAQLTAEGTAATGYRKVRQCQSISLCD